METADNIVERLPGFYRATEKDSYIYEFVSGFARIINEQEKELAKIRDAHWIDSSRGINLDLLASIFGLGRKRKEGDDDFRSRIAATIADLRKGGTVEAIRIQLAQYLATSKEEIVVVEYPPTEMTIQKAVLSGDTWSMKSSSINNNEKVMIILSLENGEAIDPTIIMDTDTNFFIRYKGTLKKGDLLEINEGKARLNGVDVSSSISYEKGNKPVPLTDDLPQIARKPSKWIYREKITDTLARFDQSRFDENVFFKFVPPTSLTIKWTARLLGSFEVRIPSRALETTDLTKEEIEELVNAIKAAGIRSFVTIMTDKEEEAEAENLSMIEKKQQEQQQPDASLKPSQATGR